jgi:DNA topoisomerase-2
MGKKSEPMITKCKEGENWTKVTFKADLAKFSMTHLEEDVVALMKKRVVDIAGCLGKTVKVELNGSRVPVKSFQDYVYMYLNSASEPGSERPKRLFLIIFCPAIKFLNVSTVKMLIRYFGAGQFLRESW